MNVDDVSGAPSRTGGVAVSSDDVTKGARMCADSVTRLAARPHRRHAALVTNLRRSLSADDIVHVSVRAVVEIALFRDDEDRRRFLRMLTGVAGRYGWLVHSYCLMSTHYHLVVEAPRGTLSAGKAVSYGGPAATFNPPHRGVWYWRNSPLHSAREDGGAHPPSGSPAQPPYPP